MPRAGPANPLEAPYEALSRTAKRNLAGDETKDLLGSLIGICLGFLESDCKDKETASKVPGKRYFTYALKSKPNLRSRALNRGLYNPAAFGRVWNSKKDWKVLPEDVLNQAIYTAAISYSAASDLFDRNNKKKPATFFEFLIGHIFSVLLGTNPKKKAVVPIDKDTIRLTMDFIYELKSGRSGIHLPVKLSTRERVVQAWSHQRVLDAAYKGQYLGILIVLGETKMDSRTGEVIEICVPDQWRIYQKYLATLERIYYLDPPEKYLELARNYEYMKIKPFSRLFTEIGGLVLRSESAAARSDS